MSVYAARLNPDDDSGDDLVSITMSARNMGLLRHIVDRTFSWELSGEAGELAREIFLALIEIKVDAVYCDIYPLANSAERFDGESKTWVLNDKPPRAVNRDHEVIVKDLLDKQYGSQAGSLSLEDS